MKTENGHVQSLREWLTLRNYARLTVLSYCSSLRQFLLWHGQQNVGPDFKQADVRRYLLHRYDRGLKWQTINGDYSVLQQFFINVLKQEWGVDNIPRPRTERSLPAILSQQEVGKLINAGSNLKAQAFMALLYGSGLRLSEALNLELTHIDGDRQQIRIIRGKGRKDRYVGIPLVLLEVLRTYYLACRPVTYLFNGQHEGCKWSSRSAQYAVTGAGESGGIIRDVSPHLLRHCYATHHLEAGTNLVYLKEQLGHRDLKTTARYIHLCVSRPHQVHHPLDQLSLQLRHEAEG